MVKVRFLEGCYVFSTGKSYDPNDITELKAAQAKRLSKRGVVDILKDEDFVEDVEDMKLEDLTVAELREIADGHDVVHTGLRKAELVNALKEVL